jgi:hypothetical protein
MPIHHMIRKIPRLPVGETPPYRFQSEEPNYVIKAPLKGAFLHIFKKLAKKNLQYCIYAKRKILKGIFTASN